MPELTTPAATGTSRGCRALEVQDGGPGWLDPAVREIKIFFPDLFRRPGPCR